MEIHPQLFMNKKILFAPPPPSGVLVDIVFTVDRNVVMQFIEYYGHTRYNNTLTDVTSIKNNLSLDKWTYATVDAEGNYEGLEIYFTSKKDIPYEKLYFKAEDPTFGITIGELAVLASNKKSTDTIWLYKDSQKRHLKSGDMVHLQIDDKPFT